MVLDEALAAARAIGDEWDRASALSTVAKRLGPEATDLLGEVLAAARAIRDEWVRAGALSTVAERLGPEEQRTMVLGEALAAAHAIGNEGDHASALSAVTERLGPEAIDLYAQVLQSVASVVHEDGSTEILSSIVPQWPEVCRACRRPEFDQLPDILKAFARTKRENLLGAIEVLLPVIARLGGERAARETAQAIVDTARWWA